MLPNIQPLLSRVQARGMQVQQPQATQAPTQGIRRPMMRTNNQPQRVSPGVYRQADGSLSRGSAVKQYSPMAQALAGRGGEMMSSQPMQPQALQYQAYQPQQMPQGFEPQAPSYQQFNPMQVQQGFNPYFGGRGRPLMMPAGFDPNRGF